MTTYTAHALQSLLAFITERYQVFLKKSKGLPKPWTTDRMLQQYRFTNVYREDDAVTKWIATHWRKPLEQDPHLWFAMVVARLVNTPDTLEAIAESVFNKRTKKMAWRPEVFVREMHRRRDQGQKVFSSAYIVSTNGHSQDKAEYLVEHVLNHMWAARTDAVPNEADTLAQWHNRLMRFNGLGSFMAAQVVADVKYATVLRKALDWHTWAASGPGSRRGLNIVCGKDPQAPWKEREWLSTLQHLHKAVNLQRPKGMPSIHAQDLQNCLCEYSKYIRGYSRQKYPGA